MLQLAFKLQGQKRELFQNWKRMTQPAPAQDSTLQRLTQISWQGRERWLLGRVQGPWRFYIQPLDGEAHRRKTHMEPESNQPSSDLTDSKFCKVTGSQFLKMQAL